MPNYDRASATPYDDPAQLERAHCALGCNPDRDNPVLVGSDRLYGLPGKFRIVRCGYCGLMRTDPRPTPSAIGAYYPSGYGPHAAPATSSAAPRMAAWRRALNDLVEYNDLRLPPLAPGRLLEVGAAGGAFMLDMRRRGWDAHGIEVSDATAQSARSLGLSVTTGPIETVDLPRATYNLVVGWMVLEHLHDPLLALERLHAATRPGGWLVLSVPDASAWTFRLFRSYWYELELPRHLFHFTPRTLRHLLGRAGWQPERLMRHRLLSVPIGSLGLLMRHRGVLPRVAEHLVEFPEHGGRWHAVLFPLAAALAAAGQTGRMTVWARRPDA